MTEHPLITFLQARYDEQEEAARAAFTEGTRWVPGVPESDFGTVAVWRTHGLNRPDRCSEHELGTPNQCDDALVAQCDDFHGMQAAASARHIAAHDPAYVLADIAAKRRTLGAWLDPFDDWSEDQEKAVYVLKGIVLRSLAEPFMDHPDYPKDQP